jgi:DNA-binding beta-propeller fold protein YncE
LVYLFALRSLRLVGAGSWQDFIYLTYVPELASVDFSDNPGIGCQRLRDLASTGIAVTANVCAEPKPPIRPGGFMSAVELNRARTRAFVSVESINAVYEVDVATHAVVRAIGLPGETYRLDLSADETTLYVTLKHIGSVAFVNLANGQAEIVNVGDALANLEPNDILEAAPNRVLVASAGPFHGYIALVRRDLGNSVTRAANGRIIAGVPRFGASADRSKIFIDEDDTLLRLDSTQPTLPVAAETLHRLNGGGHIVVSADGSRVYASIRDIFDGQSLLRVGATANPVMSLSADGTGLILPAGSEDLGKHAALFYDADTLLHTGTRDWGCDLEPPIIAVEEVPGGMLAADRNILCGTRTVPY